jgi:hypothetical protein
MSDLPDLDKYPPANPAALAFWCRGWIDRLNGRPAEYDRGFRRQLLKDVHDVIDRLGNAELARRLFNFLPDGPDDWAVWLVSPHDCRAAQVPEQLARVADWCERQSQLPDDPPQPPGVVCYHGELSYSADGHNPITVSNEMGNVLEAFRKERRSLGTPELAKKVANPSKVMSQIGKKFPDAVRKPVSKGDGYFVRVVAAPNPS